MKISKKFLNKVINEELKRVVKEYGAPLPYLDDPEPEYVDPNAPKLVPVPGKSKEEIAAEKSAEEERERQKEAARDRFASAKTALSVRLKPRGGINRAYVYPGQKDEYMSIPYGLDVVESVLENMDKPEFEKVIENMYKDKKIDINDIKQKIKANISRFTNFDKSGKNEFDEQLPADEKYVQPGSFMARSDASYVSQLKQTDQIMIDAENFGFQLTKMAILISDYKKGAVKNKVASLALPE